MNYILRSLEITICILVISLITTSTLEFFYEFRNEILSLSPTWLGQVK